MGFKRTHTEEYINKFFIFRIFEMGWGELLYKAKEVFCGIQFVFKNFCLYLRCRLNWEVELNILYQGVLCLRNRKDRHLYVLCK